MFAHNATERRFKRFHTVSDRTEVLTMWTPYRLRNSAATTIELNNGLDAAQAQLGHKSADMTRRYSKAQLRKREQLARVQVNPFDNDAVTG